MNKENRKYLIPVLIASGLMFVWIFVTVFLTGGREISDFTTADKTVFLGFIVTELITIAVIAICLTKVQKLNKNKNKDEYTVNAVKRPVDKRRIAISVSTFIALFLAFLGGIIIKKHIDPSYENVFGVISITAFLLPVLFLIVSIILNRLYGNNINKKSVSELQQFIISHRENPEESIAKKQALLKAIIRLSDFYSILIAVCAFISAFSAGIISKGGDAVSMILFCYIILSGASYRIRLKTPDSYFSETKTYVSESEFPALYALAKKAASASGQSAEIRIALLDDYNAGIADIDGTVSVQLGVLLLDSLSEEELFSVLLHEFSHIGAEEKNKKISSFYNYLSEIHGGRHPGIYFIITKHLFTFIDNLFNFQYSLYHYSASVIRESEADKAMAQYSDVSLAASALIKLKYYELFDWQDNTYDTEALMESEEYDTSVLKRRSERFKSFTKSNSDKWNLLIENEIISRNATHPTLKMRLEALGVKEIKPLYPESTAEYKADCEKAFEFVSSLIKEVTKDDYEQQRKYYYTESKELIEEWEYNGKKIIAEEYSDICNALRRLGRNSEALELCENAISQLDETAACFAYYMKGCFLLHSFDETGLRYIYKAIELNHNYIDEGLEIIGQFCCLTGKEDQLEIFRERAVSLAEMNKNIYSETGVLNKKDRLSPESLPEGMLEDILSHITSENSDSIEKIYLVRKTITDDFFTSVFVIKMLPDTDDDIRYEILHRAFNYLDTCSDRQFSLFDYEDVRNVKIENIDGSCVYMKEL